MITKTAKLLKFEVQDLLDRRRARDGVLVPAWQKYELQKLVKDVVQLIAF